jgi:hypothetical protein
VVGVGDSSSTLRIGGFFLLEPGTSAAPGQPAAAACPDLPDSRKTDSEPMHELALWPPRSAGIPDTKSDGLARRAKRCD